MTDSGAPTTTGFDAMTVVSSLSTRRADDGSVPGATADHHREKRDADSIIWQAIMEGLGSLGASAEEATLYFIRQKTGLKPEDIPANPDKFCLTVREIFQLGSLVLLRSMRSSLGKAVSYYGVEGQHEEKKLSVFMVALDSHLSELDSGIM
jgi:hypothetical protein